MKLRHILIPASVLGFGVIVQEAYAYVFRRNRPRLLAALLETRGHADDYYTHRDTAAAALRELPQERWTVRSSRGETLQGYYIPGAGNRKRVAFVVHGYRSDHADTAGMYYDFWRSRGFDLFCCDHAAHGASTGKYIGFSVFERDDCLLWLQELIGRLGPEIEIVLHGFSMGGATVLRMTDRLPPQVKFVIEDSGFASAEHQLRSMAGPAYSLLRLVNRYVARYDLSDGDTAPALQAARVPILFVHGTEDTTVPYRNGPALYEAYTGEKACLFVPGAKHVESFHVAPEAYAAAVDAMIDRHIQ